MPFFTATFAPAPTRQSPPVQTFESFKAPFVRRTCRDRFGRAVTYYLSNEKGKLPITLLIPGSGGQSIWVVRDGKLYGGLQNLLKQAAEGRVRVLAVEKVGIPFAFQPPRPGTAEGAPEEFLKEHTLDRWAEANEAALRDAWRRKDVDRTHTLVIGHSEGGIVAARVAAEVPKVTHLGLLASGGANQLYDLSQLLPSGAPAVYAQWKEIQKDPASTSKFAWGHPYRRWSSFLSDSTLAETVRSKANVFVAQGTSDRNVVPSGADLLNAELTARGRSVVYERVVGGDHSFSQPGDSSRADGFRAVFQRVLGWFLGPAPSPE
jgi:dienelactone hydrolase